MKPSGAFSSLVEFNLVATNPLCEQTLIGVSSLSQKTR